MGGGVSACGQTYYYETYHFANGYTVFFIVCLFSLSSSLEFWGSEIMYTVYNP